MNPFQMVMQEQIDKLDDLHKWWPKYLYHYSNIDNIVSILEHGCIYSRNKCMELELMRNENASLEVIEQTNEDILDYVRLYFRPKTPTQYHNEGFRPTSIRKYPTANVSVPIFLAFRSYEVLNYKTAMFSQTSLATHSYTLHSGIDEFCKLDFEKIYHDRFLDDESKAEIVHKRQAEVVIKDCLSLDHLDMIWCRSNAEYVTLVNLLSKKKLLFKYRNKISVKQASSLFFLHAIYVKQVDLLNSGINFWLANANLSNHTKIRINFQCGTISKIFSGIILTTDTKYHIDLTNVQQLIKKEHCYEVTFYIEDEFVYFGTWNDEEDMPF